MFTVSLDGEQLKALKLHATRGRPYWDRISTALAFRLLDTACWPGCAFDFGVDVPRHVSRYHLYKSSRRPLCWITASQSGSSDCRHDDRASGSIRRLGSSFQSASTSSRSVQNSPRLASSEELGMFLLPIRLALSISNKCPAPRLESATALDAGFETAKNSANKGAPLSGSMIGGLTQPRKIEHRRS